MITSKKAVIIARVSTEEQKEAGNSSLPAQVVEKMYEWYSTTSYSMLEIRNKLKEVFDLEFFKGKIDFILKNPFYCGMNY